MGGNAQPLVDQKDSIRAILDSIESYFPQQSEESKELALKGLSISLRANDQMASGLFFKHLGASEFYLGNYASALESFTKARQIFIRSDADKHLAKCFYGIGLLYSRMQYFDSATTYLNKAQNLYIKTNDPRGISLCLTETGLLFFQNKDYGKALEYFTQAYERDSMQNLSLDMVQNLGYIGGARMYLNELDKAERAFRKSLKLCRELSDLRGVANEMNHLGVLYEKKQLYDSSRYFYQQDLRLTRKLNDQHHAALCNGNIGISHAKEGNYDSALFWTSKKIALARKLNDTVFLAEGLFASAQFFAEAGEMDSAFYHLNSFVALDEKIQERTRIDLLENISLKTELNDQGRELKTVESNNELQQLKIKQKNELLIISLLSLGLILGSGFFFIYYRQQKFKEAKTYLELRLLRSRINPHNVFNAFNSIQSFFITKEYEKGENYLRKFAKLIRMLLEKSETMFHSLARELDYIKSYMEIESLRMEKGFEFSIDIPNNLDLENTLIPTLISQTYLENALQHGISSSNGHGKIQLEARKKDNVLYWIIRDNGIGINQSLKNRTGNTSLHQSQGLKLNDTLLRILSKGNGLHYTVTINEIDSEQGVIGTEVVLKIPQSD